MSAAGRHRSCRSSSRFDWRQRRAACRARPSPPATASSLTVALVLSRLPRRGTGRPRRAVDPRHSPQMDAAAGAGLRPQHRHELSRHGDRHRARPCARPRARSRSRGRLRASSWLVTQFFRNAPWLVLLFYCILLMPFEVRIGGIDRAAARLGQGDRRPRAARDGERRRAGARRRAVDPVRPMGGRGSARLHAAADAASGHPAAMREAHDAALDEPLRHRGGRQRRSPRSSASARR